MQRSLVGIFMEPAVAEWVRVHGARESSTFEEVEELKKMAAYWARAGKELAAP